MKKAPALVFASFLVSACVPAMVTKSPGGYGRVTDARTHAPVANARVRFIELHAPSTTTDKDGRFDLAYERKLDLMVLLPGQQWQEVTLQVVHPGYRMFLTKVSALKAHEQHDVELEPQR